METKKAALITPAFFIIGVIVGFGFAEPYVNCVWHATSLTSRLGLDEIFENTIRDATIAKDNETRDDRTAILARAFKARLINTCSLRERLD
jgi:hypothetical protein